MTRGDIPDEQWAKTAVTNYQQFQIHGLNISLNQVPKMEYSHRHDEIELNFVEKGAIAYLFAGEPALIEVSNLALFWAATPHQLVWASQSTVLHWLTIPLPLFLQWDLPNSLVRTITQGKLMISSFIPSPIQGEIYKQLFYQWNEDLHSATSESVGDRRKVVLLEIQALLHRMAFQTAQPNSQTRVNYNDNVNEIKLNYPRLDKIEQMARFIAEHHTSPLSINQVAESVALHPKYAMRAFQKVYGVTVLSYLTQHRLAHAQRLLATSDQPILEIGFEVGFSSTSRFYSVFKANCGVTPLEYRKSLRT